MNVHLANPFINSVPSASFGTGPAVASKASPQLPGAAAGLNSVSDGARLRSLPSGEIEPSVTLARAPSESGFSFQPDFEALFNNIMSGPIGGGT